MSEEIQKKSFMKNMKQELKRVIWPTAKQTTKNTMAVICVVFLVSAVVLILDFAFRKGNDFVVDKVTGGKVTEYKVEIQQKSEILKELQEVNAEVYQQYAPLAYYLSVEDLEKVLEEAKNPTATEETETTEETTETSEQTEQVEETTQE